MDYNEKKRIAILLAVILGIIALSFLVLEASVEESNEVDGALERREVFEQRKEREEFITARERRFHHLFKSGRKPSCSCTNVAPRCLFQRPYSINE